MGTILETRDFEMPEPTKKVLVFEKHYDDSSGVRASVSLDTSKEDCIEIMSVGEDWTASFPVQDLPWLIECLQRIHREL